MSKENEYFEIRLESIGGLGANLCGKMLGELGALYLKLNALNFSSYGSEKRGSPVKSHIRWCSMDKFLRLCTPIIHPNMLGVFHEALLKDSSILSDVTEECIIILHTNLSPAEASKKYHIEKGILFCVPALDIAIAEKSRINMVMLGAISSALSVVPLEMAEELCKNTIGQKYPYLIEANLNGLRKGYSHIQTHSPFVCNRLPADCEECDSTNSRPAFGWGFQNAPIGGINPILGSTVSNDLSAAREGYIPLFVKERCIHCGLCDSTCPDYVFQFEKGVYKDRECMVNTGLDYTHCKGCLRCVDICPTNALVTALEKDYPTIPYDKPNKDLITTHIDYKKHGADASITGESYLTEQQIGGGIL